MNLSTLQRWPWIWSLLGAIGLFIAVAAISNVVSLASLTGNIALASFLVLTGLGQMFVITGGEGAIDLSVPGVVTTSAILAATLTHADPNRVALAFLGSFGLGLVVGLANGLLVTRVRIAPVVATLGMNFVLGSAILLLYPTSQNGGPAPGFAKFVHGAVLGIPLLALLAIVATALAGLVLHYTIYGRQLEASGQSRAAAALAGARVWNVRWLSYGICSTAAAIAGFLLMNFSGGAFLGMGVRYQLESIATAVLGGTVISGGASTAMGAFTGALFLTFIISFLGLSQFGGGPQDVVEGLLVLAVLVAGRRR